MKTGSPIRLHEIVGGSIPLPRFPTLVSQFHSFRGYIVIYFVKQGSKITKLVRFRESG